MWWMRTEESFKAFNDIFIHWVLNSRSDTRVITRALGRWLLHHSHYVYVKLVSFERLNEKSRTHSYQKLLSFPVGSI